MVTCLAITAGESLARVPNDPEGFGRAVPSGREELAHLWRRGRRPGEAREAQRLRHEEQRALVLDAAALDCESYGRPLAGAAQCRAPHDRRLPRSACRPAPHRYTTTRPDVYFRPGASPHHRECGAERDGRPRYEPGGGSGGRGCPDHLASWHRLVAAAEPWRSEAARRRRHHADSPRQGPHSALPARRDQARGATAGFARARRSRRRRRAARRARARRRRERDPQRRGRTRHPAAQSHPRHSQGTVSSIEGRGAATARRIPHPCPLPPVRFELMADILIKKTAEEPGAASLAVTVPAEHVREAEERATTAYQRRVRLPGFRKGKAPTAIVKKQFAEDIRQQVLEELIRESWRAALAQEAPKPKDLVSVTIATRAGEEVKDPQNYQLVLGEGRAIPEVEERIMALTPGQMVDATVRFPPDFPE